MPALTPAERAEFIGPRGTCHTCGSACIRQYCRSCDEFFNECRCPTRPHVGHRTYRWVAGVIVAVPDFDTLLDD
jgi:hypothetical protein